MLQLTNCGRIKAGKPLDARDSVSTDSEAHLFYGRLQYSYLYWGGEIYFHLQICFYVLMVQIADLCCEVKIKNDIFVFLFGMFSKVMFL